MAVETRIPPFDYSEEQWGKMSVSEKALLIAAQECDFYEVEEEPKGSNRGPRVDAYLRAARTAVGQAWCAAFITFCMILAGHDPFSKDPKKGVRYPASVASWREYAKASGRWSKEPKRGRLFVLASSHIGFVTRVYESQGTVQTIEGNSNDEGGREGYEVTRRIRKISSIEGFINLADFE